MQPLSAFSPDTARRRYVSAETLLKNKALAFVAQWPDVHGLAWATARTLLHELTGKSLNPGRIWWHRFNQAASSPHTYTGWRHVGAPVESMTLVELVMRRFNAHDQQAPDELSLYGGFYTDGPEHDRWDEHNEVVMQPRQVLERFWQMDFASLFQRRLDAFWGEHAQTFCELARARFLAAAGLAVRRGDLGLDELQLLGRLVTPLEGLAEGGGASVPLAAERAASVRSFDIDGHESYRIVRVVDARGWQILYAPGLRRAFHVCKTERDLYEWVRGQLFDEAARQGLEAMFVSAPQANAERAAALGAVLDRIRDQPFAADRNRIEPAATGLFNQHDRPIAGDVFEHLRELALQEMQGIADSLTGNAGLRKQMWIGHLQSFIRVTGPMTLFGWPLALVVTGAGLASMALNVDQALHGNTARQRQAGTVGAILDSIFVLFNLPLLVDTVQSIRAIASDAGGLDAPLAESPLTSIPGQSPSHERLLSGQVPMQGVERNAAGETWIMLDEQPRQVRFSARLNGWAVVDPANPFSFYEVTPVRLGAQGQWERLPGLRLLGGMEPAGSASALPGSSGAGSMPSVSSPFWDLYMQFDLAAEESLSELALARQKAAIHVREVQAGDEIEQDLEGDDVLVDAWNTPYRVFKRADGRYAGGRVTRYTEQEEAFNQYLRTGVANVFNQVALIDELADDLALIGHDNRVNLYRGGSGARSTSGLTFRSGQIKAGDVLVNTDFTSFSENPYVTRSFASSQAGAQSYGFSGPITFDNTSIVFELPAGQYLGATPIAAFSVEDEEAESLFTPGHYFQVQGIHEVVGPQYRFVRVQIKEIPVAPAGSRLFEMRTGLPFTREQYAARLGENGKRLVDRFFPTPLDLSTSAGPAPVSGP